MSKKPRIQIKCKTCSNVFEVMPCWKHRKYCSVDCSKVKDGYWIGKKRDIETNIKISKTKKGNSPVTHTSFKEGHKTWNKGVEYLAIRKENHWNWKGGVSDINKQIRHSVQYNVWRKTVYARDNWTCRHCNVKQKYPVAHHIKTFKEYPELRFDVDNGLTLCRACHKRLHTEIGVSTRFIKQLTII
jgi:ribosomal protein L31